jgi:hypothetical protein
VARLALRLAATVASLAAALTAGSPVGAQPAPAFDTLSETQQRLLAGLATSPPSGTGRARDARAVFDAADASFRAAFATITTALATVSLSDHENGEVLGVALDLVNGVEPLGRQPAVGSAAGLAQLSVTLAPGARDRLRRSSEFAVDSGRATPGYSVFYVQKSSPLLQFALDTTGSRGLVSIPR